jgi:hypothetical protein
VSRATCEHTWVRFGIDLFIKTELEQKIQALINLGSA